MATSNYQSKTVNNNDYILELDNITKIFPGIVANDNITLKIKRGEIHALIGENGAGKSTLMSILFGLYHPTSGVIKINGEIKNIANPIKANELGIGMVHQHFKLVNIFSELRNIVLGDETVRRWQWLDLWQARTKVLNIAKQYNLNIKPNLKIKNASVAAQQQVEIMKMLYRDAEILIFDEPTAVLAPQEIESLLDNIIKMRDQGKTIIFISHKLQEIQKIADRVSILRKGKLIGTYLMAEKTTDQLAELMVGTQVVDIRNTLPAVPGEPLLQIRNLTASKIGKSKLTKVNALEKFNLTVHAGEIVAIAGIEGNGQTELAYALSGLIKPKAGKILLNYVDVTSRSILSHNHQGLIHIPEDRQRYALVLDETLINNMVLESFSNSPFAHWSILNRIAIQRYAQSIIAKYDVVGSRMGFALARALSGGNQQKAVVGRELTRKHNVCLVVQPTRGLDVGAINFIHSQLINEKKSQNAVLLISYELSEILALADRIIVIYNGVIMGEMPGKGANPNEIGLMMLGQKQKSAASKKEVS